VGLRAAGATGVGLVMAVGFLQLSAMSTMSLNCRPTTRLGYAGVVQHVEGRCGVGSARRGLQWSNGELGRRLGLQYLRIKIHCRTDTIYSVFCTES
jgi:hypothetical protein